jgi:hypothetical protein
MTMRRTPGLLSLYRPWVKKRRAENCFLREQTPDNGTGQPYGEFQDEKLQEVLENIEMMG